MNCEQFTWTCWSKYCTATWKPSWTRSGGKYGIAFKEKFLIIILSNLKNILLFCLKVLCPQNIPRPDEHHGRREDLCGVVLPGGVPSGFFPTRSWSGTGIQRSGNAKLFTRILKLISFQTESYKYLWEKITRFNCWHYSTVIIQQTCASGMTTEIAEWMACSKSTDTITGFPSEI